MTTKQEIEKKVEEINNEHKQQTQEVTMEEVQTQTTNWLAEEYEKMQETQFDGERLESLKMEENKVTSFKVDISEPFGKYDDAINGVIKKIIPVEHEGIRKNLWLNVKNPLYSQIVDQCHNGDLEFKVMRTGQQAETRYHVVSGDAN